MEVKEIVERLMKSEDVSEHITPENVKEVEYVLESMKKNMMGTPDAGPMGMPMEMVKFDSKGQWSIEKANTLDYSKINQKPDYKSMEAKAPTLDYSKMSAPKAQPKPWAGAADKASKVKSGIKTGETAVQTMQGRGQIKKQDAMDAFADGPEDFSTATPSTPITGPN
jgi:hypothetical protein